MSTQQQSAAPAAPTSWGARLKLIGPGFVLAMASVGAGDMVTTLNSASTYGLGLVWIFTLGIILKFALSEAVGRLQLAGPRTLISRFTDVGGRVFPSIFLAAFLLVGLFFGSGLTATTTQTLQAIFPGLPFWPTAVAVALSCVVLVGIGKYGIVEKAMMGFGFLMFFGMIAVAFTTAQADGSGAAAAQTASFAFPDNSIVTALSLLGGVGGAVGILAYGYWIREGNWQGASWKGVVRLDSTASYFIIFVFASVMSLVGTFVLYTSGQGVDGNSAVLPVAQTIGSIAGDFGRIVFLLSFFAIVYTSILGGFSAMGYLLSDTIRVLLGIDDEHADRYMEPSSWLYRLSLIYSLIATLIVMTMGKPVTLVLVYATVSAFVLPILSMVLLILLNRTSTPAEFRNGTLSNVFLSLCLALFGFLAYLQIQETVGTMLG